MKSKEKLLEIIKEIHVGCFQLCKLAFGKYLPVAGNIGVFCQSKTDFETLSRVQDQITQPSDNPKQKYFQLKQPIVIPATKGIPETAYRYLYIRKPSLDSSQAGDVDFILPRQDFQQLKQGLMRGESIPGAKIYDRPGWDMIELSNPAINALAYVTYQEMAEKVRVRFD